MDPTLVKFELNPDVSDEPAFQDLLAYWQGKRGGRDLPLAADFDVVEVKAHIGFLILLESLPDFADFRFRLIGTAITAAYSRDSTGKTTQEVYGATDPEYGEAILHTYRAVATARTVGRLQTSLRPVHRDYRRTDGLLLPWAGPDGSVTRILIRAVFHR
ncbi:MAG TPA: PAS domain-containing protein [Stellaceae bacterium]|nr:PAS domain-containing protein [Stellaceae bacterium]